MTDYTTRGNARGARGGFPRGYGRKEFLGGGGIGRSSGRGGRRGFFGGYGRGGFPNRDGRGGSFGGGGSRSQTEIIITKDELLEGKYNEATFIATYGDNRSFREFSNACYFISRDQIKQLRTS